MHLLLYEFCCVQSDADPAGLALLHEGWGMLRALVEDLSRVGTYRLTILANPSLERRLRKYPGVEVVVTQPEEDVAMLAHWAPRVEACLVIAPEFRNLLVERVAAVRTAGGTALNCSEEFIHLTGDKYQMYERLRPTALRMPRTMPYAPGLDWAEFPAVLKPVDGAGSQATYRVASAAELHERARQATEAGWPDLIVQPYLVGTSASLAVLGGPRSQLLALPMTEQLLSTDDRLRYVGARYPLAVEAHLALEEFLRELRYRQVRGWVGVDVVIGSVEEGFPVTMIEINPRLTTSYLALRQQCQQNLADALVQVAAHGHEVALTWGPTPLEFRL